MPVDVKICGLTTAEAVDAAVEGGARWVGFVFFPPSPRSLTPAQAAPLAARVRDPVIRVALTVDAEDAVLDAILAAVRIDLLQLHGDEPPARAAAIRARYGLPVMKALAITDAADLDRADAYADAVDRLLFDARPPPGATRPGGNARSFDWSLLRRRSFARPWLLAGGLDAGNLAAAVAASGARAVDVSSGVEAAPGVKSAVKIRELLALARTLDADGPSFPPSPQAGARPI
ncbi:MAG: phosphoribosylanthranilate isomerase [Rhodospirillales bacterium]|jgi:phosphoribosylanthranilate isomerase|nr:phosphoribosylanthranilate isomerase [Rhodospirillales bacterium]